MQEINWNNFKAKFNGKEQSSFEWLCYLLFCKEFNRNIGISRYKNHAGIETHPIEINGKKLGWQAKFYDTRLSEHKEDFITSIDTAKARHPEVNKIIFYTNQDFGQDKKKTEPKYKTDIEKHAKSKDIEIEWRTASFFESPFVCEENSNITRHFLGLEKSVIDFISELILHTKSILKPIHSNINFNDKLIKIDRVKYIEELKKTLNSSSLVILSGEAGVGKTAVIKDFYDLEKETRAFYVFKSTEFAITNVNQLFKNYGIFTLSDFIKVHEDIMDKVIVIDSAEKLSDIEHQEVFQEFLSALLNYKWRIIFTTRYSYLDDLKYKFVEIYKITFKPLHINNLTIKELEYFSEIYKFNLPANQRWLELLRNPFYLNEYLQIYKEVDATVNYSDFNHILWNKQISKTSYQKDNTHIKRENCFIKIAQKRANDGYFFVKADECENEIVQRLISDEIIQYDSNAGGYFITHDIYEEWALDKIIERAFRELEDYKKFYQNIGDSLPIRRAFRNWLSEKLFLKNEDIKILIESTIKDDKIEKHWQDEIIVSILLSDYSENFIQLFETKLLEDDQNLLVRTVFLLRIACTEIDESILNRLNISKTDDIALKTLFTIPKGNGWSCVINFINKHKEILGLRLINTILPLVDDWNNTNKQGKTTKNAGQIALFYYEEIAKKSGFDYSSRNEIKNQIIRTILNGSFEIKDELTNIFNEVISKKETDHRSKYYDLICTVLSSATDSLEIAKNLPEQVIRLADLFWFQIPDETDWRSGHRDGVEQCFCLAQHHNEYYPASAFQTPIFQLLRFAPEETIDFILFFTNKTVECYANSRLKDEVAEVEVFIDERKSIKQYISDRLWNMYRGTKVSTNLLESIHMALEKWLLENAEATSKEIYESWCKYIIENSKSASITAVVTSVAFAQPFKMFNIAKILFQTREFFFYDTRRWMEDQTAKHSLLLLSNLGSNYKKKVCEQERIEACDDKHRQMTIEHLALYYQVCRIEEESDQDIQNMQETLWTIFDKYYEQLPDETVQTDFDKTWRLFLARMDKRRMTEAVGYINGRKVKYFNSNIPHELRKHSEEAIKEGSEVMKYTSLRAWSHYRFEKNEDKYKEYQQYENNLQLVITETREIIEGLKDRKDEKFSLFNRAIPAYSCSVLIRDFFDELNKDERELCRDVITGFASLPLQVDYLYQVSDGTKPAVILLPHLIRLFPEDKESIKYLLFLLLLTSQRETLTFVINGILYNLWEKCFKDGNSIFLGYLLLKPEYDYLRETIRKENYKKDIYEVTEGQVLDRFVKKYKHEIENIISNSVTYDELPKLNEIDLYTLKTAFKLLPLKIENEDHKKFLNCIFPVFFKKLFIDDNKIDYMFKQRFLEKFAYVILNLKKEEIEVYLRPFIDDFSIKNMANFFSNFIMAEDDLKQYEAFWIVWNAFYTKIADICKNKSSYHYTNELIHNYLLAGSVWRKGVKEWHTLKDRDKLFFKKVAEDIGHHPAVLYSISKVLNDIGSKFIEDGVFWISNILQKNESLLTEELEINTIYYIENFVRRYILKNRYKVKTSKQIKKQIMVILNFLVERGSVTGYLLREDIL